MRIALAIAALAACLSVAPVQAASDIKVIGPGNCQPYGQSSTYETLAIRADGIQNKTTNTNKYIICPLDRDSEDGWTPDTNGIEVIAYFNHVGAATISCTLTDGQDFSGLVPTASQTLNATVAEGPIKVVQFNNFGAGNSSSGTMTCRLPPGAKFLTIFMEETSATNTPDAP